MRSHHRITALLIVATCLATLAACTSASDIPERPDDELAEPEVPDEPVPSAFETYRDEAEAAFELRSDRESAQEAIEMWQRALDDESAEKESDSTIASVFEDLARAYYFVARYHAADGPVPDRDGAQWAERGEDAAIEALRLRAPDFHDAIIRGAPFEAELPDISAEAVDAVLWYAKNITLLANTGGVSRAVASKPILDSIMETVLQYDPGAHYGAAHRFFGVRWIDRSFHRDPDASRDSFEAAADLAPEFVLTYVLEARYLAIHQDDRDRFEALLTKAISTVDDADSEPSPENRIVRSWAQALLDQADEYFD